MGRSVARSHGAGYSQRSPRTATYTGSRSRDHADDCSRTRRPSRNGGTDRPEARRTRARGRWDHAARIQRTFCRANRFVDADGHGHARPTRMEHGIHPGLRRDRGPACSGPEPRRRESPTERRHRDWRPTDADHWGRHRSRTTPDRDVARRRAPLSVFARKHRHDAPDRRMRRGRGRLHHAGDMRGRDTAASRTVAVGLCDRRLATRAGGPFDANCSLRKRRWRWSCSRRRECWGSDTIAHSSVTNTRGSTMRCCGAHPWPRIDGRGRAGCAADHRGRSGQVAARRRGGDCILRAAVLLWNSRAAHCGDDGGT